jgi:universal stress protein family protein
VAIDGSPNAGLVTDAAARLAAGDSRVIRLVHAQESPVAGDGGVDGEALKAARAVVRDHLDRLAASGVPAEGHVLLHAADHGTAGRLIAEYANEADATTILIGAPGGHNPDQAEADSGQRAEQVHPQVPRLHVHNRGLSPRATPAAKSHRPG